MENFVLRALRTCFFSNASQTTMCFLLWCLFQSSLRASKWRIGLALLAIRGDLLSRMKVLFTIVLLLHVEKSVCGIDLVDVYEYSYHEFCVYVGGGSDTQFQQVS